MAMSPLPPPPPPGFGIVPNPKTVERSPALDEDGGISRAVGQAVGGPAAAAQVGMPAFPGSRSCGMEAGARSDVASDASGTVSVPVTSFQVLSRPLEEWPPLRCTPSLQAPQGPLVDFLTSGYGYDDQSVATAVRLGNDHFARRELGKAIDYFGAAYEIGRLHFDYKPLMHDLILRRVICYSMQGDLHKALSETDLALRVVPHSAVVLMYRGLLHGKLGDANAANRNFQLAVAQCRELRDFIDCVIALFMHSQGHCDRAIQICQQVLKRQPRYPFALLVRGDAYKFHASGYFVRQAADDYTMLLEINRSLQPLIGDLMTRKQHTRFDEMILTFHPRLQHEGPRPYEEYPMCAEYRKRRPFLVVAFVLFATAKLKTCVRSSQLVRNVEKRNEELLTARSIAERKVRQLVETQQRLAAVESSSYAEVWGPADPDHVRSKKYRRYWMERPLGFPRRHEEPEPLMLPQEPIQYEEVPSPTWVPSPRWVPAAPQSHRNFEAPMSMASDRESCWSMADPQSPAPRPRLPAEECPALLFSQKQVVGPDGQLVVARTHSIPEEHKGPGAAEVLLNAPELSTAPHPDATRLSSENCYAPQPVVQRLGQGWTDAQWLAKALELADTFEEPPAAASPRVTPRRPAPQSEFPKLKLRLPGGAEEPLADAIQKHGVDVIPDLYTSLDRIYEVCDMGPFRIEPAPVVAAPGVAGAPGYSYVVPKAPPGRPRSAGRMR